ncbi:ABC transporter substrate-binding protein [Pseudonocardia saturnea]
MPVSPRPALLLATAALLLAGCAAPAAPDEGAARPAETRVVSTEQGEVAIPADPQRIVVLNSALAGYFYALDVPVHGAIPLNTRAEEFPEFWAAEAAADGTVRLPWSNDGFNVESLLAEAPDLIVGGGQGFPGALATDAYAQLSEIAPTVLVSSSLTTWQSQLDYIAGEVLDVPEAEQRLLDAYAARVGEVREAITVPPTPASYILVLADGTPWSIPETAALPATLSEVGIAPAPVIADNPQFETYGTGDSFEVSTELAGQAYTGPSAFVLGFQADVTSVADLAADPIYARLPSFAAGQAYDLPYWAHRADYYATMALLDEVERMFS